MKIYVKGGAWKNIEDEILKTAVMKYGKNNWPIIASLLPRKSAKQCKARWYEWLDPNIKKTEWSRLEDEKLLHLAKFFPTQWRTIAPAVGRTASQCLERYEQLLDEAQERDGHDIYDPNSILNPRRLRPGEIDPNPESKPAKPDAMDMDEDELEMLSEAKARLSNTMGKKDKRKAREAAMDEERRLASVQRAREMKAAGIRPTGNSKYSAKLTASNKKRHFASIDVNKEIPHYHRPQPGLYDTAEESSQRDELKLGKSIEEIEGKRAMDIEREKRKEDQRKQALRKRLNLPQHFSKLNRMHEEAKILDKRDKLSLPSPQVTDKELDQIGRMGYQIEKKTSDGAGGSITRGLLSDYKATPGSVDHGNTPGMTPRTGQNLAAGERILSRSERLKMQARNLINISKAQTPLLGGENTPLNDTFDDFQGMTPQTRGSVHSTPLVSNFGGGVHMTPSQHGTNQFDAGATPMHRDQFKINETPLNDEEEQIYYQSLLAQLRTSLQQLPKPKPTTRKLRTRIQVKDKDTKSENDGQSVRDASEIEAEQQLQLEREHREQLKKRSQAVKRNLPRPKELPLDVAQQMLTNLSSPILDESQMRDTLDDEICVKAQESIVQEMQKIIRHDAAKYPYSSNGKRQKASHNKRKRMRTHEELQPVSLKHLEEAESLLHQEYSRNENTISTEEFTQAWMEHFASLVQTQDDISLSHLTEHYIGKNSKLSKKCVLLHGGYMNRESTLLQEISQMCSEIAEETVRLDSYKYMSALEASSGPVRAKTLQNMIQEQRAINRELQEEHANLAQEQRQLKESTHERSQFRPILREDR